MLGSADKIAKHTSFVFRHPKNAISQSPFRILHIVYSSSKDLNRKLLLLCRLRVCLPVSSMLKLRLPQFLFYRTAPFFPWSVWIQSNCYNTLAVLRHLFVQFQLRFAQKRKLAFWRTTYENLGISYPRHFSRSPALFGNHRYRLNQLVLASSLVRSHDHNYHKWYF